MSRDDGEPTSRPAAHPLRPLTSEETSAASAIVKADRRWHEQRRFFGVWLHEPHKNDLADAVSRRADAVLVDRASGQTSEVTVDLNDQHVVVWRDLDGDHAAYLMSEYMDAIEIAKHDPRYVAAMAKRGITDLDSLHCDTWPAGNFGVPEEQGRRLVRVVSYLRHGPDDNGYAHPIEGVVATVDATSREVIELVDGGVIPVPQECGNYRVEDLGEAAVTLKPLEITQPEGASFTIDDSEIRWHRWSLRATLHPLDGLVLHTVGWDSGERVRPVLHRASLAEMVVPYGSTAVGSRWKNAFDSGEVGIGRAPLVNSLKLGCDCLGEIHYLDAVQADENGDPFVIPNAICIHEEDVGILWKHTDLNTGAVEVRRNRRLVVSSIHTVGNYEYGFYWYFYLDGTIEHETKLTGILQTEAALATDDSVAAHATRIGPDLFAPYHQHLFCMRLDLDVDGGGDQTVEEVELAAAPRDHELNPYGNALERRVTPLLTGAEGRRTIDATTGRHWRVVNTASVNRLGQPVAYKLVPGSAPTLLAREESSVAARAEFARANLWVTAYDREQTRAAGYPTGSIGGGGLPAYVDSDASIAETDVVLWFTYGVNHIPRLEDFPVMPVERAGFSLIPSGFFDRNPALELAPPPGHAHGDGAGSCA
jgi:primary-amine oxidase